MRSAPPPPVRLLPRACRSLPAGLPGLVLATAVALAACGRDEPAGGGGTPLRVGVEAQYEPFESRTADGKLVGFDIDLAEAIGRHLGREVVFSDMSFDALIPELQAGRIDFACSAVSRTPERAAVVDFSAPYVKVPMAVLGSSALVPEGRGLDALSEEGVSIAVQRGTSGEKQAAARFPRARIVQFGNEAEAALEVGAGRAHAFVYDLVTVVRQHEVHRATTRILDREIGIEEYAIAFPKGSPLRAEVDAFLAEARRPGGAVDAVFARWRAELDARFVRTE